MECFKIGDHVNKKSGYSFPGEIRAVFTKTNGDIRYVDEFMSDKTIDGQGMLHIFSGKQLILMAQ